MSAAVELKSFSYRYPASDAAALKDVSVSIAPGEFVLVGGDSGSGKSTFLRAVLGLVPHHFGGEVWGEATIAGHDLRGANTGQLAAAVGSLFQDPESQSVMDSVRAEIAFPLENQGWEQAAIESAVARTAQLLGIEHLLERRTDELSGGELQRVVLAAALSPGPQILVLDEPTSQLDASGVDALLATLSELAREHATTIILAEHRTAQIRPHIDRELHFDAGHLTEGFLQESATNSMASSEVRGGSHGVRRTFGDEARGGTVLGLDGVGYRYPRGSEDVLRGVELSLAAGERAVLVGDNGSGKSTLLQLAKGLREPSAGSVTAAGEVALLLQNPNDYLIHERVGDEAPLSSLERFGVAELVDRDPRDLSGGQRQRVALAIVMQERPAVLLLDEPSRGMAPKDKAALAELIGSIADQGTAVLVATHDLDFAARFAERRITLAGGHVQADGPFAESATTAAGAVNA